MTTPLEEERAARKRHQQAQRAAKARSDQLKYERRLKLRSLIDDAKRLYPGCRCTLTSTMDDDALRELGTGCCTHFVCPCLDKIRRGLG